MAIKEKTVQFSFPTQLTLVPDATVTNLEQITVYIPESNPTFTSVIAEVGFHDVITATGGSIASHRAAISLGGAAYTTITQSVAIGNTSENIAGVLGPFNFTSHFDTNWSGTNMTCDFQVYFDQSTGTTLGMANVTAVIYITYQYDDAEATQIKTVRLPFESMSTALPIARGTQFGNQIPQLTGVGGFLPEAGVTIRDYYIIVEGNTSVTNNATDFTVNIGVDGSTTYTFMTSEAALGSDVYGRWIWKPSSIPDTSVEHLFELWSTGISRLTHTTVTLVITYEFTLSGTSRVLNSIVVPIEMSSPLGATSSAQASRALRDVIIEEPGTIIMRHSGFRINWNFSNGAGLVHFRCGSQAFRSYSTQSSTACGMFSLQQRIDSGSLQGAGLTLQRGRNSIIIDGYQVSTSVQLTNINGYIVLNYESDLSLDGIGSHSHTILRNLYQWNPTLVDRIRIDEYALDITETNYFLISTGFVLSTWGANVANGINFDVSALPGEGKALGYYDIYNDVIQTDAERGCSQIFTQARSIFKRFPQDVDTERLDIESARTYRLFCAGTLSGGIYALLTYHTMTWNVAGNISGHNPALPTDVDLVRDSDGEVLQTTTLSAGTTAFDFTVYDNTEDYYVSAFQDNTHVGRSASGKAS